MTLCPGAWRLEQLEQPEQLEQLEQPERRVGAAAPLKEDYYYFYLLCPLSFDLSLACASAHGTLFDFLRVPFLQACLNLRNWGFSPDFKAGFSGCKEQHSWDTPGTGIVRE